MLTSDVSEARLCAALKKLPVERRDKVYLRWLDWLDEYLNGPICAECGAYFGEHCLTCSVEDKPE